jgi:hypothetical protein
MTQLVSTGVFFGSAFYVSMVEVAARYRHTVKKVSDFPSPAGMSLTKLSLARNN